MRAYQEIRNGSFSENFAYVLNGWPLFRLPVYPIVDVLSSWDLDNWERGSRIKKCTSYVA